MGFQKELDRERAILLSSKKPYETAAFIIFVVMFLQQFVALLIRLNDFRVDTAIPARFNVGGTTVRQFFVNIIGFDNSSKIYIALAFLALAFWYYLVYRFVWKYSKDHGYAKWTWTVLIVFGPNLLFTPAYIFYAIYVFRPYFFRFIKTVIVEYKEFDPKSFAEDESIHDEEINQSIGQFQKDREDKATKKAAMKEEKQRIKDEQAVIDNEQEDKEPEKE